MSPARPSHLQLLPPTTSTTYGTPCNTDADASAAPSALGVLDALFFTRGSRIYKISRQRARNVGDSLPLRPHDATRACLAAFDAHYERRGGSVATALAATYGRTLAACLVGMLLLTAITIFAPLVLQQVVLTFSAGDAHGTDKPRLGLWLAVFIASRLVKVVVSTHVSYHVNIVGMRTAATVRAVVYRKVLHKNLCTAGGRPETRPDVMNLVTTDLRTLQELALVGLNVFTLPIQIGVTTYLLYSVLNVAAFAGIAVIVTTLVGNYLLSKRISQSFARLMQLRDDRMKVVKETFGAIQIVKFNAWEPRFKLKLLGMRAQELRTLAAYSYAGAASAFVLWTSPLMVSTVAFAVYALALGETLTAAKVFTSMALFNTLRDPLRSLPYTIQLVLQAAISVRRIDAFLKTPEFEASNVARGSDAADEVRSDDGAAAVCVTGGRFTWTAAAVPDTRAGRSATLQPPPVTLSGISFALEKGDFAVVYGGVGSGKSSLCSALLGEMHKISGQVEVRGRVVYYAQQPWIQNMSIRDNILFGDAFDAARYDAVLDACCLWEDLSLFPAGDKTEIGEKGVNLSGGQKARVSLARACYARAHVYVLDSPLAAVDTVVQKAIFRKCLCGLLADKTVILVTHNPEIIASKFVTYRIGLANGALVENARDRSAEPRGLDAEQEAQTTMTSLAPTGSHSVHRVAPTNAKRAHTKPTTDDGILIREERREEGRVADVVWRRYLDAIGGVRMLAVLLLSQLLWQGFQILSDFWLSHWTSGNRDANTSGRFSDRNLTTSTPSSVTASSDVNYFIATYAELAAAAGVMVLVRGVVVTSMGLRASKYLFESMTDGLLHAPLRFFDANPIGRILNRFGGDINAVDVVTPTNLSAFMASVFTAVCSALTATLMIQSMSLCLIPIVYFYLRVLNGYVRTFRDIRRLMSVAVSPILSHLAQSEQGVETIRAFGSASVRRAVDENQRRIDVNNELWYTEIVMIQWFSQRMQLLCVSFLAVIVASFVVFSDRFSAGLVGLTFTYALSVDASLVVLVKTWSRAENSMVNVERVLEYSSLAREGGGSLLQVEPPAQWPQRGAIVFERVAFSYTPHGPRVLQDVSFAIRPREKVGIVGRTGAGKSSLTMALFRMNELVGGRILVDGVDIATLPLAMLRSRMSIIPQAPVLLEGSLRNFLDPFDDFQDADVLQVLEHVEMLDTLCGYAAASAPTSRRSAATPPTTTAGRAPTSNKDRAAFDSTPLLPSSIATTGTRALAPQVLALRLSANGDNLSVGERQMLCMARALLKRSTIVVMDEATAAMDHVTEQKLSAMIKHELRGVTLLVIAHRLATVMASDRIMVLQEGRVVEFGSPTELLQVDAGGAGGVFFRLVQEAKHSSSTRDEDDAALVA